jgi:hypothetical protein
MSIPTEVGSDATDTAISSADERSTRLSFVPTTRYGGTAGVWGTYYHF